MLFAKTDCTDKAVVFGKLTLGVLSDTLYRVSEKLIAEALKGTRMEDELEIEKCILGSMVDDVEITLRNGWIAGIGMKAAAAQ